MLSSLREMQETLDEEKENIPEGIYLSLMNHLSAAYREQPSSRSYFVVSWVSVSPNSSYRVNCQQHSTICEEVTRGPPPSLDGWAECLRSSHITRDMARQATFPLIIKDGRGGVMIVCSAEEYDDEEDL